jgi:hypothetical protein
LDLKGRKWQVSGENRVTASQFVLLYDIINIIKSGSVALAGHVAGIRDTRNERKNVVGIPEERRPRGRPGSKWDNFKTNLREIT